MREGSTTSGHILLDGETTCQSGWNCVELLQRLDQHRSYHLQLCSGIQLNHPKHLPVYFLGELLFDMYQHKQALVFRRRQRRVFVGRITAIETRQAVQRVIAHPREKTGVEGRDDGSKFIDGQGR